MVREGYSPHGNAWAHVPHDHASSKAYRWGEDGIGGIGDRHQYICFALALWNGRDTIRQRRESRRRRQEDYFYLDSTPTHSYMKFLYKYPQRAYPYAPVGEENRRRGRQVLEYELLDTGIELWDENDGSTLTCCLPDGRDEKMRVRSMVGPIPLSQWKLWSRTSWMPAWVQTTHAWFIDNRPDFREHVDMVETLDGTRRLLSIVNRGQIPRVLCLMLDERNFLSPYGVRSVSQVDRCTLSTCRGCHSTPSHSAGACSSRCRGWASTALTAKPKRR